jgi:Na+/H+-translocating membrane pyrophosphatase
MGADLFGSFAESACAAMVISSQSPDLYASFPSMCFPLVLSACGIIVCLLTTFVATHLIRVKSQRDIEPSLKRQLLVSTFLMTPIVWVLTHYFFPPKFMIGEGKYNMYYAIYHSYNTHWNQCSLYIRTNLIPSHGGDLY